MLGHLLHTWVIGIFIQFQPSSVVVHDLVIESHRERAGRPVESVHPTHLRVADDFSTVEAGAFSHVPLFGPKAAEIGIGVGRSGSPKGETAHPLHRDFKRFSYLHSLAVGSPSSKVVAAPCLRQVRGFRDKVVVE